MACDTCSHAMQNVGAEGRRIFWCPRCGTLKTETEIEIQPPMLVERVRMMKDWPRAVAESVTTDTGRIIVDLPLWLWLAVMESAGIGPEAARKNVGA